MFFNFTDGVVGVPIREKCSEKKSFTFFEFITAIIHNHNSHHKSCSNLHNSFSNTIIIYVYVIYIIMITPKKLQAFHLKKNTKKLKFKKIYQKSRWPTNVGHLDF